MKILKTLSKEDMGSHYEPTYHDHKDVTGDIPIWPPNEGNDLLYN